MPLKTPAGLRLTPEGKGLDVVNVGAGTSAAIKVNELLRLVRNVALLALVKTIGESWVMVTVWPAMVRVPLRGAASEAVFASKLKLIVALPVPLVTVRWSHDPLAVAPQATFVGDTSRLTVSVPAAGGSVRLVGLTVKIG